MIEWKVLRKTPNTEDPAAYDIFSHEGFRKYLKNDITGAALTLTKFEEILERNLRFFFWNRAEYENVYEQIEVNWDNFINYTWMHLYEIVEYKETNEVV